MVMLLNLYLPVHAFEEICMLDHLSGGRLELGVGRGTFPVELSYFAIDSEEGQGRYEEARDIILAAVKSRDLSYHGRYFKLDNVPLTLTFYQQPHPPLWLAVNRP